MATNTGQDYKDYVDVWTDGSGPRNGPYAYFGGIGVFWGDNHPWNVSRRAKGRTSNSCEIEAAICAIQIARDKGVRKLRINTDSEILITCAVKWLSIWRSNGWMTADGGYVKNRMELMELSNELDGSIDVIWKHVSAHSGHYENVMADRLAKLGARN